MTKEEEKRLGEIVDELIDKRIAELSGCRGCEEKLVKIYQMDCIISKLEKVSHV